MKQDKITDFYKNVVEPFGHFKNEDEFRQVMSDGSLSKTYFSEALLPMGVFKDESEFNSYFSDSTLKKKEQPQPLTLEQKVSDPFLQNVAKYGGNTQSPSQRGTQQQSPSKSFTEPKFEGVEYGNDGFSQGVGAKSYKEEKPILNKKTQQTYKILKDLNESSMMPSISEQTIEYGNISFKQGVGAEEIQNPEEIGKEDYTLPNGQVIKIDYNLPKEQRSMMIAEQSKEYLNNSSKPILGDLFGGYVIDPETNQPNTDAINYVSAVAEKEIIAKQEDDEKRIYDIVNNSNRFSSAAVSGVLSISGGLEGLIDPEKAQTTLEDAQLFRVAAAKDAGLSDDQIEGGISANISNGDWGAAFTNLYIEATAQAPQLALMYATGGTTGLTVLGASAAGSEYATLYNREDITHGEKILRSALIGGVEILSERIFAGDINAMRKALGEKELKAYILGNIKGTKSAFLNQAGQESFEELFSGVVGQVINHIADGTEYNIGELVDQALIGGVSVTPTAGLSYVASRGQRSSASSVRKSEMSAINESILKLKSDLKTEGISNEEKSVISEKLDGEKSKLYEVSFEDVAFYDSFSKEDISRVIEINNEIYNNNIKAETALTISGKESYNEKITALQQEKTSIEQKYTQKSFGAGGKIIEGNKVVTNQEVTDDGINEGVTEGVISPNTRQSGENMSRTSPIIATETSKLEAASAVVSRGQAINDVVLEDAISEGYSALDAIEKDETMSPDDKAIMSELIEDEIQKLEGYDNITTTETRKIAEAKTVRTVKKTPRKTIPSREKDFVGKKATVSDNKGGGGSGVITIMEAPNGREYYVLERERPVYETIGASTELTPKKAKKGKEQTATITRKVVKVDDLGQKFVLGEVGKVFKEATVNRDKDGNPTSVTMPVGKGGKQVTIKDAKIAQEFDLEQGKQEEFDEQIFEETYIEFVGEEKVEVKKQLGHIDTKNVQEAPKPAKKAENIDTKSQQTQSSKGNADIEVGEKEIEKVAEKTGITPKNLKDLYAIGRDMFGLNKVQAFAQAVVMDRMIGAMATRKGVKKSEIYKTIEFRKGAETMPQGVKFQLDLMYNGSGSLFDKFDSKKIGTGVKAMRSGWGFYFTKNKGRAAGYAKQVSGGEEIKIGDTEFKEMGMFSGDLFTKLKTIFEKTNGKRISFAKGLLEMSNKEREIGISEKKDYIEQSFKKGRLTQEQVDNFDYELPSYIDNYFYNSHRYRKLAKDVLKNGVELNQYPAYLYAVTIAENGNWIDENNPVDGALYEMILSQAERENSPYLEKIKKLKGENGGKFYGGLVSTFGINKPPEQEVSEFLMRAGVDGNIGYQDADTEYVVFDENAISIEEVIKFQKDAIKARGAMMMALDGKAIIYALTDPNVSTPLHELAHVFEHYLTEAERNTVIHAAKTKGWTTETSEYFARGFEKYLADGKAPSVNLQKLFSKFKEWLTDIYNGIKGSEIDIELNSEMKAIYDKMLGEEKTDAVKEAEAELKSAWNDWKASQKNLGVAYDPRSKAAEDVRLTRAIINYIVQKSVATINDVIAEVKQFTSDAITLTAKQAETLLNAAKTFSGLSQTEIDAFEDAINKWVKAKLSGGNQMSAQKDLGAVISSIIKDLKKKGYNVPVGVANRLIKNAAKVRVDSQVDVLKFIESTKNTLKDYEWRNKVAEAIKLQVNLKTAIKNGNLFQGANFSTFVHQNPALLDGVELDLYIDFLSRYTESKTVDQRNAFSEIIGMQNLFAQRLQQMKAKVKKQKGAHKQTARNLPLTRIKDAVKALPITSFETDEDIIRFLDSITAEDLLSLTEEEVENLYTELQNASFEGRFNTPFEKIYQKMYANRASKNAIQTLEKGGKINRLWRDYAYEGIKSVFGKSPLAPFRLAKRKGRAIPFGNLNKVFKGMEKEWRAVYDLFVEPFGAAITKIEGNRQDIINAINDGFSSLGRTPKKKLRNDIKLFLIALEQEYRANLNQALTPQEARDLALERGIFSVKDMMEKNEEYANGEGGEKSSPIYKGMTFKQINDITKDVYKEFMMSTSNGDFDHVAAEASLTQEQKEFAMKLRSFSSQTAKMEAVNARRNGESFTEINSHIGHVVMGTTNSLYNDSYVAKKLSTDTGRTLKREANAKPLLPLFVEGIYGSYVDASTDFYAGKVITQTRDMMANIKRSKANGDTKQNALIIKSLLTDLYTSSLKTDAKQDDEFQAGNWFYEQVVKKSIQAILSKTDKFFLELLSNLIHVGIWSPREYLTGILYYYNATKQLGRQDIRDVVRKLGSSEWSRMHGKETMGKFMEKQSMSPKNFNNPIILRLWDETTDKVAMALMSSPDRVVAIPLWHGVFNEEFKKSTGEHFQYNLFLTNAQYRRDVIEIASNAKILADKAVVIGFATTNAAEGILRFRGAETNKSDKGIGGFFRDADSMLMRFLLFDLQGFHEGWFQVKNEETARKKFKGARLMTAVVARQAVYSAGRAATRTVFAASVYSSILYAKAAILNAFGDDDDEEKEKLNNEIDEALAKNKENIKKAVNEMNPMTDEGMYNWKRSFIETGITLASRNIGSLGRGYVSTAAEMGNKRYGYELGLRETNEYNFGDEISFAMIRPNLNGRRPKTSTDIMLEGLIGHSGRISPFLSQLNYSIRDQMRLETKKTTALNQSTIEMLKIALKQNELENALKDPVIDKDTKALLKKDAEKKIAGYNKKAMEKIVEGGEKIEKAQKDAIISWGKLGNLSIGMPLGTDFFNVISYVNYLDYDGGEAQEPAAVRSKRLKIEELNKAIENGTIVTEEMKGLIEQYILQINADIQKYYDKKDLEDMFREEASEKSKKMLDEYEKTKKALEEINAKLLTEEAN